jgi:hypothetical protein
MLSSPTVFPAISQKPRFFIAYISFDFGIVRVKRMLSERAEAELSSNSSADILAQWVTT